VTSLARRSSATAIFTAIAHDLLALSAHEARGSLR
jgi:hypothetical protein